jgi:predicted RNase H-like nuclease (RuvC/YqgF family)
LHDQQEEIKKLRGSSANVSYVNQSNNQQHELLNKTLKSRVQDLESQVRNSKLDYDNQIRTLENRLREANSKIETYERQLRSAKVEDSRATGYTPVTSGSQTNFGTTSTLKPNTGAWNYGASSYTPSSSSSSSQVAMGTPTGPTGTNTSGTYNLHQHIHEQQQCRQ